RLFKQICGFGDYGFPESHAASFARLTWISCWLKCYYPAAYTASILNSLPMGFYAPAQLVADVRRHGVEVRAVDVNFSDWNCTLEKNRKEDEPESKSGKSQSMGARQVRYDAATSEVPPPLSQRGSAVLPKAKVTATDVSTRTPGELAETHAIRLGFRMISGISESAIEAIVSSRQFGPFTSFENFVQRTRLNDALLKRLSRADAFSSLNLNRREALWEALPSQMQEPLLRNAETAEPDVALPEMSACDGVVADYNTVGLSLRGHPFEFIRPLLATRNLRTAEELPRLKADCNYQLAGLVIGRQRPQTAKGVTFVTLEDETGSMNLIIWPDVWEKHRAIAEHARILLVSGQLQKQNEVIHIVVDRLEDISHEMSRIKAQSRDFR
ncbi:MAG: OB-fold nucleic acid binding domain-containing protein, partial [Planctomycetaceae bacterium]